MPLSDLWDANSPKNPNNPQFMTPEQLETQREWAKALYGQSDVPVGESGTFKAVSPFGGLVPMANALAAQHQLKQFGQGQRQLGKEFAAPLGRDPLPGAQPGDPGYGPNGTTGVPPQGHQGVAPTRHSEAPPQIKQMIAAAEQKYASQGLPPGYLEPTLGIESSFNPNSYNELSHAAGIAQFIPKTGRAYGLKEGRGPGSAFDPAAAIDAAARYAVDNAKHLARNGIQPTAPNLYMAHQQGASGATAILSNPNVPAGSVGGGVTSHAISANGGDPRAPAGHFAAKWAAPFQRAGAPQQVAQAQPAPQASDAITSHYSQADRDYVNQHQAPQAGPAMTPGAKLAYAAPGAPAGTATPVQAPITTPPQAGAGTVAATPAAGGGGITPQSPVQVAAGGRGGSNTPITSNLPPPAGGSTPATTATRQPMSYESFMQIMSAPPGAYGPNDADIRKWALETYKGQYLTVEGVDPLGRKVMIPHGGRPGGGQPMTINPPTTFKEGGGPGVETQTPSQYDIGPNGETIRRIIPDVGGTPAKPADAQSPAAPSDTPPPPLKPQSKAAPGPTMTDAGPEPLKAGTKLAALDGAGPALSTPPPAKAGTEAKTAEISPRIRELSDFNVQQKVKEDALKEYNKKDIDEENKGLVKAQETASSATGMLPQIKIVKDIINQPGFTQGPGTDLKLAWTKAKALFGDKAARDELAYNQAFEKIKSGNILNDMRAKLGDAGLGPVRNAEIRLLETAAPSQYNTLAANRAIIDMNEKYQEQLSKLGDIASGYHNGWRWNDKTNAWFKTNERPTTAGLNDVIRKYLAENPVYKDDKIREYMKVFAEDKKAGAEAGPTGQGKGPFSTTPPPATPAGPSPAEQLLQRKRQEQQQIQQIPN